MENNNLRQTVDGCTAATYIAYALSDVATIYPITPIASMGETAQQWAARGKVNIFGNTMQIKEMESELGAAGATHGAAAAGALATTFTASQGLMLMIPNMYKIAGELLPVVFHVGTRSLATHALSIFGDHQDIMATRASGFAFLASCSVQEAHDMALVAHLAAIEGSVPVCHFFDGWRTSNQIDTISLLPYEQIRPFVPTEAIERFRQRGLNPEHPCLRGSAQNPDVYFQNREAANKYYTAFPRIVQKYMDKVARLTGRQYKLFDYFGDPQAENIIISIGSAANVVIQTLDSLNRSGYKAGSITVRLYRPFSPEALLNALPPTVKRITVLDRTKEPGADGEPLLKDVATAILRSGKQILIIGGRYGLSSKEFDPAMVKAIFDNMASTSPKTEFTIGITDDVTNLSLPVNPFNIPSPASMIQAKFFGFGSDGSVGAAKQLAKVLADTQDLYTQAFFQYSAKKSGGYTISSLRLDKSSIQADYGIENADYIACHKDSYVQKYQLAKDLRINGIFVLNSPWNSLSLLDSHLPASLRRALAAKKALLFNIDAAAIAAHYGLGVRINMIMATAFLLLMKKHFDPNKAIDALKQQIKQSYIHEGEDVVTRNIEALDSVKDAITPINYPASWAALKDPETCNPHNTPSFITKIAQPCLRLEGDSIPVSALTPDGTMPMGTTAYEKRRIALNIPLWNADKCIECTLCSLVCPHAAIRPFLLSPEQNENAPEGFSSRPAHGPTPLNTLKWRIQIFPEDCTGCGSCAAICPGHALSMMPAPEQIPHQIPMLTYCLDKVGYKPGLLPRFTIKGSQFHQPLMQFSGACAGCGETPYVKLLTQLFGERMVIANATGCSSIWSANFPSNAYCVNQNGQGPAWANSLFEDNAEYGYGMAVAIESMRSALVADALKASRLPAAAGPLADALTAWANASDAETSAKTALDLIPLLNKQHGEPLLDSISKRTDLLVKKSVWAIGGDGWAYDIGFAGLDHVLARRTDINILVLDTECYSNTGGQMSKATPISAVAKYAPDGKRTLKKDLGRMMMTYGNVYVASIALGANPQQTITALKEAESYPGPSIVIAYCPCIAHGIRAGMSNAMIEEKKAVRAGYWPLYRYNPSAVAEGKEPLTVDSPAPDGSLPAFLSGESRYESLREKDPKEADLLQKQLSERQHLIFRQLLAEQKSETQPLS